MIVTEVVPFLILAIGVDNMFILSKAYDREQRKAPTASVEELVGRALAEVSMRPWCGAGAWLEASCDVCGCLLDQVGPSITAAASSEVLAFGVGATTHIPALESFCLVASVAVLVDFVLQITWFVAGVAMDARRMRVSRWCGWCPHGRDRGKGAYLGAHVLRGTGVTGRHGRVLPREVWYRDQGQVLDICPAWAVCAALHQELLRGLHHAPGREGAGVGTVARRFGRQLLRCHAVTPGA